MKICECITYDSFVLTGASVFALINSSIRRYLCGIRQFKAIVLVKKLNEAIVLVRPLRQHNSPIEAKQLAHRCELQQQRSYADTTNYEAHYTILYDTVVTKCM